MTSIASLAALLSDRRFAVLTGAGVSTESGISDYRGPETARRARNPMRFEQFVSAPKARARYWARSTAGWPKIAQARPNAGHEALARLERRGAINGLITQNVDRLHHRAGSQRVIELHGSLHEVRCLACGHLESREGLQQRLLRCNPGVHRGRIAPDGDADIDPDRARRFRVADCLSCAGPLKPDVVFFGENVPRSRVEAAYQIVDEAEALLVVGTSLTVFSGYRFVKRAAKADKPIAILNLGPTRGDPLATVRIETPAGAGLAALERALEAS